MSTSHFEGTEKKLLREIVDSKPLEILKLGLCQRQYSIGFELEIS